MTVKLAVILYIQSEEHIACSFLLFQLEILRHGILIVLLSALVSMVSLTLFIEDI